MRPYVYLFLFIIGIAFLASGCSMTAGGDMSTTTQVNPTVSPDLKLFPQE